VTVICHRLQRTLTPEYCHVAGNQNLGTPISHRIERHPEGSITSDQFQ
jgi:hypothetical protein